MSNFCSLIINGDKLDFEDIEKNIKLNPTDIYHKGGLKDKKYNNDVYSEDGWVYEVTFGDNDKVDDILSGFVSDVLIFKDYISSICHKYHVRLWCDIYSDYAQINILLSPSVLQKISDLGIGIDFQVYSHGDLE